MALGQKVAEDVPDQTLSNVELMMEQTGDQLAHLTSILPINEKMLTKETLSKGKNKGKQLIESTDSTINEIVESDLIDQVISHNSRSQ